MIKSEERRERMRDKESFLWKKKEKSVLRIDSRIQNEAEERQRETKK